jgi:asparagine synthase (glutamine-hydrolysing)
MCGVIRHRGPDDEGVLEDGSAAIGMRRLSIIDLSAGHQPMSNEDGSVWVVFNGEIYNYRELREDLVRRGHRFTTHSDTETLVHLYEDAGTDGLARLRGMFAFAIWDRHRRRMMLARDRFGKKPLYWATLPQGLYFGSELKCLQAASVPFETDPQALALYLQLGYVPDPFSIFRGVRKLPPGGWITYGTDGAVEEGRYWRLPAPAAEPPGDLTERDAASRLRDLFDEAVRIRMEADVPLGAFLSGGVDSSSVVASMALQSREPIKTFSIGFDEADYSELPWAELVARRYKTEHHAIVVRPNAVDLAPRIVRQFDEPFGDSSAIPTLIVSEFARQHVKVALSGDGGDELFAGYDSFFLLQELRFADRIPPAVRRMMAALSERLPYSTRGVNRLRCLSRPTALDRYFELNYAPYLFRRLLLRPDWILPADGGFFRDTLPDCLLPDEHDALLQAFYFEATANLTGDMLVKVDRMSMAASLEVRCPLLDHPLAELAARFPPKWKMRGGRGKHIFLEAVGDRLPPELLNRPKKGFSVPLPHWFRGELKDFLQDHLLARDFLDRGFVAPKSVRYLIEEHMRGRRNNHHWLWRLLVLALWLRQRGEDRSPEAARRPDCREM